MRFLPPSATDIPAFRTKLLEAEPQAHIKEAVWPAGFYGVLSQEAFRKLLQSEVCCVLGCLWCLSYWPDQREVYG